MSAADTARAGVLSLDTPAGAEAAAILTSPTAGSGSGTGSGWDADPAVLLVQREQWGYLQDAIETLPDRLRFVVRRYFFEQRPMAELAAVLGVTDSRISQLRAEAVRMLHAALAGPLHVATDAGEQLAVGARQAGAGARVTAARQAYVAAVAARSSTAARLQHTNGFAEPRPYDPTEATDGLTLPTAG